jgi:hypothetical protein
MKKPWSNSRTFRMLVFFALAALPTAQAEAQDAEVLREAAKHFERGVSLYGEADYRGALVEFKRASGLVPNPAVLYNVGETEFQLQEYANALVTFERYLAEAGPTDPHRAEVEAAVRTLKTRVGHLAITSSPTDAEIAIDDQPIGRTPIDKLVMVSAGRRKVVATLPGRAPATKYVDVAAEDVVSVSLQFPAPSAAPTDHPLAQPQIAPAHVPPEGHGSGWRIAGWVATGTFAAVAAGFGALALKESSDLKTERGSYPTTAPTLDHAGTLTMRYSVLADSLGAAALIVGGITLYSTLSSGARPAGATSARVGVGPGCLHAAVAF